MTKEEKIYKIATGEKKLSSLTNQVIEESFITIQAGSKSECEEMYDKIKNGKSEKE